MDINIKELENALNAAKEIGLSAVPWAWIKFIQSGWSICNAQCDCGGHWVWMRPRRFGVMATYGCVCHNGVDESRLLDMKQDDSRFIKGSLAKYETKVSDIGRIFYTYPGSGDGEIVDKKDFVKLDPVDVGWWIEISDFAIFD